MKLLFLMMVFPPIKEINKQSCNVCFFLIIIIIIIIIIMFAVSLSDPFRSSHLLLGF